MKIPKTAQEKPYIKFMFDKKGVLSLSISETWWGGKDSGFVNSEGHTGNTCLPKDLNSYIKAFRKREIKMVEKQITTLQKRLSDLKVKYDN